MTKFTRSLYKGIYYQAQYELDQYKRSNPHPMKSIEDCQKRTLNYWIAKVAYEWALNGIVR